MSEDVVRVLLTAGPLGVALIVVLVVVLNPDKAARWAELGWLFLSKVWRGAGRRSVQYGLQGRINEFSAAVAKETGRGESVRVRVQWTQPDETPGHFFDDDRLVIRLHSHERQDRNLMHAGLVVVSETLARRAKRFLSQRQARSVDLFAVDRLLSTTAPTACELFHEEVIGPEADQDAELRDLIVSYQAMDRARVFFPIFVRELEFIGQKVVVKPRDERLITDVKELVRFLLRYSERAVGEEIQLELSGRVLRCAIIIIAKGWKRVAGDIGPWVRHASKLRRAGYESIYLVGSAEPENREFMDRVAKQLVSDDGWRMIDSRILRSKLKQRDGKYKDVSAQFAALRSSTVSDAVEEPLELVSAEDLPSTGEP